MSYIALMFKLMNVAPNELSRAGLGGGVLEGSMMMMMD
jgi:hypothetical protein